MGEPVLRRQAAPIPESGFGSAALRSLVADMLDTMRDVGGAGLAAPQIFESVAVCVLEVRDNARYPAFPEIPLTVLVNPVVTPKTSGAEDEDASGIAVYEGCLSVPGLRGRVVRPRRVSLAAFGLEGEPVVAEYEGVPAAVLQHEVDHLNGILFIDRVDGKTLTYLDEYERNVPERERIQDRVPLVERR